MKKSMFFATLATGIIIFSTSSVMATTWMIGDDDGYGIGIPDNTNHPFDGFNAGYDGRTADETADPYAKYTDTYSTTHGSFSPADQIGSVATFKFEGLGSSWTEGSMWFDMADFQASTFGAVVAKYNNIDQNWAFNDGFPTTKVRFFDLEQDVIDSINNLGYLEVTVDRNNSGDFYGFDYALLSDRVGADTDFDPVNPVPEPTTMLLFGTGLAGLAAFGRKRKK